MLKKGGVLVSSTLLVRPRLCHHSFPRLIQVQVTGILGTKAYRCLSNAGFVIVTLSLMRAAIIAVSGVVLAEYKGGRRFTGEQCPQSMSNLSLTTPRHMRDYFRISLVALVHNPAISRGLFHLYMLWVLFRAERA